VEGQEGRKRSGGYFGRVGKAYGVGHSYEPGEKYLPFVHSHSVDRERGREVKATLGVRLCEERTHVLEMNGRHVTVRGVFPVKGGFRPRLGGRGENGGMGERSRKRRGRMQLWEYCEVDQPFFPVKRKKETWDFQKRGLIVVDSFQGVCCSLLKKKERVRYEEKGGCGETSGVFVTDQGIENATSQSREGEE